MKGELCKISFLLTLVAILEVYAGEAQAQSTMSGGLSVGLGVAEIAMGMAKLENPATVTQGILEMTAGAGSVAGGAYTLATAGEMDEDKSGSGGGGGDSGGDSGSGGDDSGGGGGDDSGDGGSSGDSTGSGTGGGDSTGGGSTGGSGGAGGKGSWGALGGSGSGSSSDSSSSGGSSGEDLAYGGGGDLAGLQGTAGDFTNEYGSTGGSSYDSNKYGSQGGGLGSGVGNMGSLDLDKYLAGLLGSKGKGESQEGEDGGGIGGMPLDARLRSALEDFKGDLSGISPSMLENLMNIWKSKFMTVSNLEAMKKAMEKFGEVFKGFFPLKWLGHGSNVSLFDRIYFRHQVYAARNKIRI